jgi:hypothetical protein
MPGILISSRIFVPKDQIDPELLHRYEIPLYNDNACARCPIYKNGERHSEEHCTPCAQYKGTMQIWREKRHKKISYIALPPGRPQRIEKTFQIDLAKAKDLRPELPFNQPIKFIKELYRGQMIGKQQTVDQVAMVADWLRRKGGIIEVPPRGGKTVIAAYIACELGLKTIIIAHEARLLRQFRGTFRGSRKYPAFTNAKRLERKLGQPIVKIINKMKDFTPDVDIALVNYKKFIRNRVSITRIKQYINNRFSFLIVDEAHMQGALQYAKFISRLNCKYRLGLSATPDRKDGMSRIVKEYLGGVVARSTTTALIPYIELVETGVSTRYNYLTWVPAMKFLAKHKLRRRMIIREVFQDLRAGHVIIIPVDFVKDGQALVDTINQQAEFNNDERDEDWPEETAVFYSNQIRNKDDLEKILGRVDNGRHKVLVAIRSKIKMGIDLATPTMLYCIVPMSASKGVNESGQPIGAPMFYQLGHRISTWVAGKQQPMVKLFIDNIPQSLGCFKSLFWQEIFPKLKRTRKAAPRYKMDKYNLDRAFQISKMAEYEPPNKPGQRITTQEIIQQESGKRNKTSGKLPRGFIGFSRAI